jgi:hypothetical protein
MRLVGRVHVTKPSGALTRLGVLARFVEVAAELDHGRAERANGRRLLGIVPHRHDHRARHALALAGEGDRLTVIAGGRGDDASTLVGREIGYQVQAAANLEGAGRVVVLVLDEDVETGPAWRSGCRISGVGLRVRYTTARAACTSARVIRERYSRLWLQYLLPRSARLGRYAVGGHEHENSRFWLPRVPLHRTALKFAENRAPA